MKKIFVMVVAAMMATVSANAQSGYYNTKHELGITIGAGAITEIAGGLSDFAELAIVATATSAISGGAYTGSSSYGDEKYLPNISVEYYYHVSKAIALGGFMAFNGLDRDVYGEWRNNESGHNSKTKIGEASRRNLSFVPTAKFDWLRKKYFGMYSKVGLGVSFMFENQKDDGSNDGADFKEVDKTSIIPNIQVSLLGLEGGSENFRGFVELGVGEQGIVLAGLKYKF